VSNPIRIGTRGSRLALIQTDLVAAGLKKFDPSLTTDNVLVTTKGDTNESPIPLDTVGKSWFTREIDELLLAGKIDLAVHSLKDLPLIVAPGLSLHIVLPRADARDCLVAKTKTTLQNLVAGSVVGTDSVRRRALIMHARPDLQVKSIRGNVQTRLAKLQSDDYDAIILAAAGLERLDQSDIITEYLVPRTFVPASGQGALAAVTRANDDKLIAALNHMVEPKTALSTAAERAFSAHFGGGCQLPVGAYAEIDNKTITLTGFIAELEGPGLLRETVTGPASDFDRLARDLAVSLRARSPFKLSYDD